MHCKSCCICLAKKFHCWVQVPNLWTRSRHLLRTLIIFWGKIINLKNQVSIIWWVHATCNTMQPAIFFSKYTGMHMYLYSEIDKIAIIATSSKTSLPIYQFHIVSNCIYKFQQSGKANEIYFHCYGGAVTLYYLLFVRHMCWVTACWVKNQYLNPRV